MLGMKCKVRLRPDDEPELSSLCPCISPGKNTGLSLQRLPLGISPNPHLSHLLRGGEFFACPAHEISHCSGKVAVTDWSEGVIKGFCKMGIIKHE